MNAAQLHTFVLREALKGAPTLPLGNFYSKLCQLFPLQRIKKKENHVRALTLLMKLSKLMQDTHIGSKEKKQLLIYMDALGLLVEEYEKKAFAANLDGVSGVDILEFLMEQHALKQSDLSAEVGSQSVVSEILSRKRGLSRQQILALSKRFGVSPAVFFP